MYDITVAWWLLAAAAFAWITIRLKALTCDGALTASALGLSVVLLAGPPWLTPLFAFFGSSLLLGRMLRRQDRIASDARQGLPRDAAQVLCNGLPYAFLVCWSAFTWEDTGPFLLVSMAAATSDTWSSEVGTALRGRTLDVIGFKPVRPGRSGGVSLAGSVAGLAGALCIALLVLLLPMAERMSGRDIAAITAFGFSGMLVDSVLGSLIQARYSTAGNDIGDEGEQLVGGLRWMTNDMVNLLSNAITTAGSLWLLG
jgi:uncharacterized protein (TIGR00297 family)